MDDDHRDLMNRTYGRMKYLYDATRPFFLAGRTALRREVVVLTPARVLEVGCGTGRNLILMAEMLPNTHFIGLDISSEMICFANSKVRQAKLNRNISLIEQEITDFALIPGVPLPDLIVFSYSLSMIPDWQKALSFAAAMVEPTGGQVLIVDFSDMAAWPRWLGQRLYKNLGYFNVFPRTEMINYLHSTEQFQTWSIQTHRHYGGYATTIKLQSPRHQV